MKHTLLLPRTAYHPLYQLTLPENAVRGRLLYDIQRGAGAGYDTGGLILNVTARDNDWTNGAGTGSLEVATLASYSHEPDDQNPQHRHTGALDLPDLLYPRVDLHLESTAPTGPLLHDLNTRLVFVYQT